MSFAYARGWHVGFQHGWRGDPRMPPADPARRSGYWDGYGYGADSRHRLQLLRVAREELDRSARGLAQSEPDTDDGVLPERPWDEA